MEQSYLSKESMPIIKRLFANIIDVVVSIICVLPVMLVLAIVDNRITDIGYFIGSMDYRASDYYHANFINSTVALKAEVYSILLFVSVHCLSQYLCERKWAATLGIRLMNGMCVKNLIVPFSKSDANSKLLCRIAYYTCAFVVCYHIFDISPIRMFLIMWVISFGFLLAYDRNVIETLSQTRTIKRGPSAKSNTNITE